MEGFRIDKWLWAARFYKTRSLAVDDLVLGRIKVNGQAAKPSREVRVGDTVAVQRESLTRTVVVRGLSHQRGPAPIAQQLYEETAQSLAAQAQARESRRYAPEPAQAIEHGRPTKRDRRDLEHARTGWDTRWSASVED